MCTEFTTAANWEASLSLSSAPYLQPSIPLRLLGLPKELRFKILEYVVADNVIPALKYSEFCRLFISTSSPKQSHEPKDIRPCTCRTSTDCHSLLHVNRQLRQEYVEVMKREANILVCHCDLFSRVHVLEQSLTSAFITAQISNLKRASISVTQSPKFNNAMFSYGEFTTQSCPYRNNEHGMALTNLGVHLTMFLTINCIDAFANLEHLSFLWEMQTETFLLLDDEDMQTVLEIVLWKTRSRLPKLRAIDVQIKHEGHRKRQAWVKTQTVWKPCKTMSSNC